MLVAVLVEVGREVVVVGICRQTSRCCWQKLALQVVFALVVGWLGDWYFWLPIKGCIIFSLIFAFIPSEVHRSP